MFSENFLRKLPINILIFWELVYFLISIIPHLNLQANAFDLGIFNQAIQKNAGFPLDANTIRGVPTFFRPSRNINDKNIWPLKTADLN